MALDAIKEVSEAERQADMVTEEAHKEAKAIIAAAKQEGEESCDKAVIAARDTIAQQLKEQEKLTETAEEKARQKSIEVTAKIQQTASANMDKAVEFIIDRVTNG